MAGDISFENPEAGEARANSDVKLRAALVTIKEAINGGLINENLSGTAGITRANLATESKPFTWYTPKVIATEESRTNTAFGKLGTADEIASVVLPTGGLILIGYDAAVENASANAGKVAIFIGANQLKADANGSSPVVNEATVGAAAGGFHHIYTTSAGLAASGGNGWGGVTTGQILGSTTAAGPCFVFAAAGTYAISVQFKASTESITAKNRTLWVATLGY